MSSEAFAPLLPVFMIALDGPAQLFIIFANVSAYEGENAIAKLNRFKLPDAQCHSDSDREELQALIAKWFTEHSTADADAEDARRVGFHRFEQFVRHTITPSLDSGITKYAKLILACSVLDCAPTFDMMCHDKFTAHHVIPFFAMTILGAIIVVPFKLFVFWRSARVVIALRERCGCPAVVAYGVGVLINLCGVIGMVLMFVLTGPTMIFDNDYRYPEDDLGISGRKMLATQIGGILAASFIMAIAVVFKI